jgi:hypothetical protein
MLHLEHAPRDRQWIALRNEIASHLESCDLCRARIAWAREHQLAPPEPPTVGLARVFARTVAAIGRLPQWARPAAGGALVLALMTSARIVFLFPAMVRRPVTALEALGTVLVAAAAGAVGGLTFSLTRPLAQRLGWFGGYLSGIVCVAAYLAAVGIVVAVVSGMPEWRELPVILVIGAFCAVLFGTLVGKIINEARCDLATGD